MYRLNDSINSVSLGILSQIHGVLVKLMGVGIYTVVFSAAGIFPEVALWGE